MTTSPVFIGGFRSGTTLLINLLGMHPQVAAWFETKCLCEVLRWLRVCRQPETADLESRHLVPASIPGFGLEAVSARIRWHMRFTEERIQGTQVSGKAAHERYPLGPDHVRYTLAEAERHLENWCLALNEEPDYQTLCQASGKLIRALGDSHRRACARPFWINKSPEISRFAPELRDCLGSCRIVYMVRNGIDVVASAHKLGWGGVESLAANWKGLLEHTRTGMQAHAADYLEIRYETLLAQPQQVLDQVSDFAGLAHEGAAIVADYRRAFGVRAFDLSRSGGHRESLTPAELDAFARIAGDMQRELGYW
ncbi:MAG: sulfotransferase [Pseudomonadales bacterium]|nr:sulfotransferase [Pseudomonadales bacterium]